MSRFSALRKQRRLLPAMAAAALLSLLAILLLTQNRPQVRDPDSPTCPGCRIREQLVLRLGAADGPGALPGGPSSVMLDGSGRYWLLFYGQTMPLVFDGTGELIAELGRRGDGPGEFHHPEFAVELPGDSVLILEPPARRATVFDRELQPVRLVRMDAGEFFHAADGHWWPRLLVSSAFRTPERTGWPLHAFDMARDDARPVQSFGLQDTEIRGFSDLRRLETHLVASPEGTLWAVDRRRYRLSEWTADGQLLRVVERSPAWFPGVSAGRYPLGRRDEPPPPYIAGANMDSRGRLWLYVLVPAPDWRDAWEKVSRQRGRGTGEASGSAVALDLDRLYQTRIEIIDPGTGHLIASDVTPHRIVEALSRPGLVAAYRLDDDTPVVSVLRFQLSEPEDG